MQILRLLIGAVYDIGRVMAALSLLAGIFYLARGVVLDSPTDGAAAVTHFALGVVFWAIARLFRRYAI